MTWFWPRLHSLPVITMTPTSIAALHRAKLRNRAALCYTRRHKGVISSCQIDPKSGPLWKGATSNPSPGDSPWREGLAPGSGGLEHGWLLETENEHCAIEAESETALTGEESVSLPACLCKRPLLNCLSSLGHAGPSEQKCLRAKNTASSSKWFMCSSGCSVVLTPLTDASSHRAPHPHLWIPPCETTPSQSESPGAVWAPSRDRQLACKIRVIVRWHDAHRWWENPQKRRLHSSWNCPAATWRICTACTAELWGHQHHGCGTVPDKQPGMAPYQVC